VLILKKYANFQKKLNALLWCQQAKEKKVRPKNLVKTKSSLSETL
jgi:hypothetical protein